jgi:predicted aldo/keto reductase-like oxidoreductase
LGFGAQHTRDADLIRYALDQGVNLIETDWAYGFGRPGNSCECIGKAIAGKRDSVCLAVAYEAMAKPTSKIWVANQFEQTLRDLKTDHIDIFLWHHPGGGSINNSELTLQQSQTLVTAGDRVDLMLKWKQDGKFRWSGITTHSEQVEWLRFMAESKMYDVAVVAFNYNSLKAIAKAMQEAAAKGIGLIAMKTQSPNYMQKAVLGGCTGSRKGPELGPLEGLHHGRDPRHDHTRAGSAEPQDVEFARVRCRVLRGDHQPPNSLDFVD